jgi:ElaB/YqjD/DUF883 family membrane-anchored ribosome-binding protein
MLMPDPLRNETANPGTQLETAGVSPTDPSVEALLPGPSVDDAHLLREAHNPRLNRTAETIGSALGTTVGKLRSNLTLVQNRQMAAAHDITDAISERAQGLSAAAMEKAEQLGDVAEEKAGQLADAAQEQWTTLRANARRTVFRAREQAAILKEQKPLHLIGAFAALGFVVGFTLRVWRSSND